LCFFPIFICLVFANNLYAQVYPSVEMGFTYIDSVYSEADTMQAADSDAFNHEAIDSGESTNSSTAEGSAESSPAYVRPTETYYRGDLSASLISTDNLVGEIPLQYGVSQVGAATF
jgi:hypothetical protein